MSTTLDFNALVSRNHEPSQIARIVPRSALDPALVAARRNRQRASSKDAPNGVAPTVPFSEGGGDVVYYLVDESEDGDGDASSRGEGGSKNDSYFEGDGDGVDGGGDDRWAQWLRSDVERAEQAERRREARGVALRRWRDARAKEARRECEDLARSLVRRTEYVRSQRREQRRRKKEERERDGEDEKDDEGESDEEEYAGVLVADRRMPSEAEQARFRVQKWRQERSLPPVLHGIEQDDWESKIDWEGGASNSASVDAANTAAAPRARLDPNDLLNQVHNAALESMDFSSFVSWDGADAPAGYNEALADAIPLILEDGVAGSSVARLAVPPNRPVPLSRTDVYIKRYEKEMSSPNMCTLGILGASDEKLAEIIAQRQAKRAMMAIDKSKRVTDAMGTLALGGGKGRAITSSLMGPGGTERTGRPSKHVGSSSAYDAELVEHLDLVYNHTLVRPDLKKSELRQFHRPRLPRSVVRKGRAWQLQMRVNAGGANKGTKAGAGGSGGTVIGGSASAAMGTHPGAISQAKIRNEADLSPAEGTLVLFEYCEERPPVQMSKGMACKIVNFYRGDKTKCPISAGGGARPPRKRPGEKASSASSTSSPLSGKAETPRLVGPAEFDPAKLSTLIGVRKKKTKGAADADKKESSVDVLPEGITEILHPKIHGPFIGTVDEGQTQSGLLCNLFAAPLFRHEPEKTDFLMILGKKPSHHKHQYGPSLSVVLRPFPTSVFCVGQTEPKVKVFAPNTTGEKNFTAPFVTYQIAKALTRTETKEGRGLRFDEINDRLFANTELLPNALRQRIKQVAIYDKNTQIWTSKELGYEDYPGVEALGRRFSPEGVASYESACAYVRRLCDLGIHDLHSGSGGVQSVGQAMVYFNGAVNAARERKSKIAKMAEFAKNSKSKNQRANQSALYEMAAAKLDAAWKEMRRKLDVARFIYEELQLAPWTLTQEFIDIHKNAQGTAMMRLTGLGDPSGRGEGYNYIRELDTKPNKLTGNTDGALNAQIKKITGTENDLRKLTMKQMASLLRSYGMGQKQIDTLKRWDRVHCIRDLSTKAASDGMGDGMERYARGEKMKLSDQKQMYRDRIQEIWKRQRAALSTDAGAFDAAARGAAKPTDKTTSTPGGTAAPPLPAKQQKDDDTDDSDSESDDDLAAALEEDMMDVRETNMLVADHVRGDNELGPGGLARTGDNQEMSKDARELAALKRQREEERLAREGLLSKAGGPDGQDGTKREHNRKCIRRRVTKTLPDGSQTTTFEFIVRPGEVEKIIAKKKEDEKKKGEVAEKAHDRRKKPPTKNSKAKNDSGALDEFVGHAMFEDEDDADHRMNKPNIKLQLHRSTRVVTKKTKKVNRVIRKAPPKPSKLMKRPKVNMGKLKQKLKEDKKIKKRRREEEEADLYSSAPHRKGTSNRRERGAARHRMPHVIMSSRIEDIRSKVERRPNSGPFHRPVDRRLIPRYYEVISEPIDLQTIRDKNQRYEYKSIDAFVRDFELMKNNAIKFNGVGSILGNEATAMYEHVKNTAESHREEFTRMEEAVQDQLNGDARKKKKGSTSPVNEAASSGNSGSNIGSAVNTTADVSVDGVTTTLNLGSIPTDFSFDGGDDSDSDDSAINFTGV